MAAGESAPNRAKSRMNIALDTIATVDALVADAVAQQASDLHVEPAAGAWEVRLRVDGLLRTHRQVDPEQGAAIVSRLMVMAQLLTYRRDVPQEGRASVLVASLDRPIELRVSIMPTTHGLRAAVRLPAELTQPRSLEALQLDAPAMRLVHDFLSAASGVLLVVGPAGSGKTTTAYAILEAIRAREDGLSVVALEDPVERDLPGVTQIQVQPFGQLTYATALRSMLRQDPQVLMLGEIRDAETASIAMQAGLSGHRLVCTFHAADAAQAMARLLEMQVEPYQISSSVFGVITQRLLRRRQGDGYAGRTPVCEAVRIDDTLRRQIVARADAGQLRAAYERAPGFESLATAAANKVNNGVTDSAEVSRVIGAASAVQSSAVALQAVELSQAKRPT